MRTRSRLLLAGLSATLMMALALSLASARNFSTNEQGFSITWAALELVAAVGTFRCPVTLHGSFHSRTIAKINDSLIGAINGAIVNNERCTGGSVTILARDLPWHIRYQSFAGTLPRIQSIRVKLIGYALQVNIGGVQCLIRTDVTEPFVADILVNTATGVATQLRANERSEIDLDTESFLCDLAGDSSFAGTAAIDGDVTDPIVVRLI